MLPEPAVTHIQERNLVLKPLTPWRVSSPDWNRVSMSGTGSWSRSGSTTSSYVRRSHQRTTRRRSSGCMPVWRRSMPSCRTSRTESRKLINSLRARTELQASKTRTGSFSAARYEARDARSASAHPPSNCCTESHTPATCSTRRAGLCSSISRRVAAGLSSSTSLMCRKRSASAMPAPIKNCFARADSSFWQWSPRGDGIKTTNSRTENEQGKSFLAPYARAHRGRHSTSSCTGQAFRSSVRGAGITQLFRADPLSCASEFGSQTPESAARTRAEAKPGESA